MKKSYKTNFKSNTHFKGVIQKMLISSLVLTSVLGTSASAFAAETPKMDMSKVQTVAYENGISVETALQEIKTTISKLKLQVSGGFVQTETLEKLASQLSQLEKSANGQSSSKIVSTLDSVESVVKGIITGTIAKEGGQLRGVGSQSWADGSPFCDNEVNNEVYSKTQWAKISAALGEPKEDGKYEGEIRNIYYQWDTVAESWLWKGGA